MIPISYSDLFIGKPPKDDPNWDAYTKSFKTISVDVGELIELVINGYSITAVHHDRRHKENFILAQHIGLDFDYSSLDELDKIAFITQYAAFTHTTSSHTENAPRSRAFFTLDRAITNATQYTRLVSALVWKFEQSDGKCTDPCRVWFGSVNATVRRYDNVLSVEVLETIADEYDEWQDAQITTVQQPIITQSIEELLDTAIKEGTPGNRHNAGFDFACNLRDSGIDQESAKEYMLLYQVTVNDIGNHLYTEQEALATLKGVYTKDVNRQSNLYTNHTTNEILNIDDVLKAVEMAAVHGQLLIGRTKHQDLKVLFGVMDIMRAAYSTEVALSVRRLMELANLGRGTVARALGRLSDQGILVQTKKSNRLKATEYRLGDIATCINGVISALSGTLLKERPLDPEPLLRKCPTWRADDIDGETPTHYGSLNQEDSFVYRAKVLGEMLTADDIENISLTYGPVCQSIITHLIDKDGVTIKELSEMASCHYGTARRKVHVLANAGIIEVSEEWRSKIVVLSDDWYEQLQKETTRLNTYGRRALIAEKNAKQKLRQHEYLLDKLPDNKAHESNRAISKQTMNNAVEDLQVAQEEITAYNQQRKMCASLFGIENPDLVPHISLSGNQTKTSSNEIRVNGRVVVPENVITKPNGLHSMDFGIKPGEQEERFEELLNGLIGPNEKAELVFLSDLLGIPLELEKLEFGDLLALPSQDILTPIDPPKPTPDIDVVTTQQHGNSFVFSFSTHERYVMEDSK